MEYRLAVPPESRIGRIIARAPDKMRHSPARLDARGRARPVKRSRKPRKPRGVTTTALQYLAVDTIERVRDGLKRYLVTFIDPASAFALAVAFTRQSHTPHRGRSRRRPGSAPAKTPGAALR